MVAKKERPTFSPKLPARAECIPFEKQPISMPSLLQGNYCKNLPYANTLKTTKAALNFAKYNVEQYAPFFIKCSKHFELFACSLHFPKCESGMVLPPCRQLCEDARVGCKATMARFGFSWPEKVNCQQYPVRNEKGDNCFMTDETTHKKISPLTTVKTSTEVKSEPICGPLRQFVNNAGFCQSLPYDYTSSESLLEIDTAQRIREFRPLFKSGCSNQLENFICSLYLPKCESNKVLPPCRELCEESRNGCNPLMEKYSFQWPEHMKCNRFPKRNINGDNCFAGKIQISRGLLINITQ